MASVAPLDTQDVLAPFEAALSRGLVREAEVFLAGLALRFLERVEAGTLDPAEANELFTDLDVLFSDTAGEHLSVAAADLLMEGEHFHHWGDEWATDPAKVRQLADAIYRGAVE